MDLSKLDAAIRALYQQANDQVMTGLTDEQKLSVAESIAVKIHASRQLNLVRFQLTIHGATYEQFEELAAQLLGEFSLIEGYTELVDEGDLYRLIFAIDAPAISS
jgi:hypothetical protein